MSAPLATLQARAALVGYALTTFMRGEETSYLLVPAEGGPPASCASQYEVHVALLRLEASRPAVAIA